MLRAEPHLSVSEELCGAGPVVWNQSKLHSAVTMIHRQGEGSASASPTTNFLLSASNTQQNLKQRGTQSLRFKKSEKERTERVGTNVLFTTNDPQKCIREDLAGTNVLRNGERHKHSFKRPGKKCKQISLKKKKLQDLPSSLTSN